MKPRVFTSSLRPVLPVVGLVFVATSTALACVQGHRFDPPKPLKIDAPRPAPLKLDELFATPALNLIKPEIAKPVVDAPGTVVPPLVSATTAEQQEIFVAYVREFEAQRAKAAGLPDTIDYAVALIRLGRHADAIETLVALEAARPGVYETAANLGTAYELVGKLEEAALWIARGIDRNPRSHAGTEWLHAAILHAKLKLRDDPAWLKTHSVIDSAHVGQREAAEIVRAIDYQLGERLQFVSAPDAVVCDLFYQAALRVTGDGAEERRADYFRESLRFGDWRKAEIAKRPRT